MSKALRSALYAAGGLSAVLGLMETPVLALGAFGVQGLPDRAAGGGISIALGWGLVLALPIVLAAYLARTARRRAREAEAANRELQRQVAERKRAEEALALACAESEARVRERTAELARANQDLTAEIAERLRTEETLRLSEHRYRELFDNANDLVYVHDLRGNFTSINKAAERITGYTAEEALTMNIAQVLSPEDLALAKTTITRELAGEGNIIHELAVPTKDGRRLTLEVSSHLVYENGIPVAVEGIARDITERRRLEEQFLQSQKMEAIGRLAGGVAHDFNNLLTVIGAYSEMIGEALPPEERLHGYAQEILWAAERAGALTNRLLAFSRRQVARPRVLDLNGLIVTLEDMLRRLIGEDIHLKIALEPEPATIKADPSHIEQVIMNLVVNARDAMRAGGELTLKTGRAEVDGQPAEDRPALPAGSYVAFEVIDTGSGMDAGILSHIFEPFFTTKEPGKGTGLGLSTVYSIVKQCAGAIQVRSEPGKGSAFALYFPRAEDSEVSRPAPAPLAARLTGHRETILLAEDDPEVRKLVRQMLVQQDYRVLEAENGEAALRLGEQQRETIHLLLTDVVMPNMSGCDLAKRLRAIQPDLKVLYMTGYTDEAIVQRGILEPGTALLKKPFLSGMLAQKVREALEAGEP